jgi:hypothetical protein
VQANVGDRIRVDDTSRATDVSDPEDREAIEQHLVLISGATVHV